MDENTIIENAYKEIIQCIKNSNVKRGQVVHELLKKYSIPMTYYSLSNKISRKTFSFAEAVAIMDILGYEIAWLPKESNIPQILNKLNELNSKKLHLEDAFLETDTDTKKSKNKSLTPNTRLEILESKVKNLEIAIKKLNQLNEYQSIITLNNIPFQSEIGEEFVPDLDKLNNSDSYNNYSNHYNDDFNDDDYEDGYYDNDYEDEDYNYNDYDDYDEDEDYDDYH